MDDVVATFRRFNRFYTQFVGALDANFLGTGMSLAEARLLFEIANRPSPLAADLQAGLEMDPGFASRVLRRFEERGWIERGRDRADGRRRPIELTPAGREVFGTLDRTQRKEVETVLARLDEPGRARLASALACCQSLLEGQYPPAF